MYLQSTGILAPISLADPVKYVIIGLIAGICALVLQFAAWINRRAGVPWWLGLAGPAIFFPRLYTEAGNRYRRASLICYLVMIACLALALGGTALGLWEGPKH